MSAPPAPSPPEQPSSRRRDAAGWRRWLPEPEQLRQQAWLRPFRRWLDDPAIWRLSRRSVAVAAAIGLFWCYMPIPLQSIPAAALAIFLRVNLPVAVAMCWISNPLTLPPMIYAAWYTGHWFVDVPVDWSALDWSLASLGNLIEAIGTPFLIGSLLNGIVLALMGHLLTHSLWRWHVGRRWQARQKRSA